MTLKPEILLDTISRHPGRTAKELLKILSAEGLNGSPGISTKQLNREHLYKNPKLIYVEQRHNGPRLWYVDEKYRQECGETPNAFAKQATPSSGLSLYPWQSEALTWWQDRSYRGIVEAVTGAGKTRLAMAATEIQLRRNQPVVVVVPTVELMHQWKREFERLIIGELGQRVAIGFFGGGGKDTLDNHDILISTPQSGSRYYLLPDRSSGLLIADEVHRYGSAEWSRVLESDFDRRLGLTATLERGDTGVEDHLKPYFSDDVFSVDYKRALADKIIAPFKIAFIAVRFSASERESYEVADRKASKYRKRLINEYGVSEEPFGEFMKEVTQLSKSSEEGSKWAGFYLSAFAKRRKTLAAAREKFEKVSALSNAVKKADKSILFSQTQEAASQAVAHLNKQGVNGAVLTSNMDMSERKEVFAAFEKEKRTEENGTELVAAPRLLDEGVDVPAADLAIVLASSRSKRQMIQRMGRVVRRKKDGRLARLAILYVEDTSEDPNVAHEDFLYLVTEVAHDMRYFGSNVSAKKICKYLNNWNP